MKRFAFIAFCAALGVLAGVLVGNRKSSHAPGKESMTGEAEGGVPPDSAPSGSKVKVDSDGDDNEAESNTEPVIEVTEGKDVFGRTHPQVLINRAMPKVGRNEYPPFPSLLSVKFGVAVTTSRVVKESYDIRSRLTAWDIHSGGIKWDLSLPAETRAIEIIPNKGQFIVSGGPTNKAQNKPFICKVDLIAGKVLAKGNNPLEYNPQGNLLISKNGRSAYLCREGKQGYRAEGSSRILDELPPRITTSYELVSYNEVVEYDLLSPALSSRHIDSSVWPRLKSTHGTRKIVPPSWVKQLGAIDGKFALADDGSGVAVCRTDTWERISSMGSDEKRYASFQISNNGRYLMIVDSDVVVVDLEKFEVYPVADTEHRINSLIISSNGRWLRYVRKIGSSVEVVSTDWKSGVTNAVYKFKPLYTQGENYFEKHKISMCHSNNGDHILVSSAAGWGAKISWDSEGGCKITKHNEKYSELCALSNDGNHVWLADEIKDTPGRWMKRVNLVELKTGKKLRSVDCLTIKPSYAKAVFASDGGSYVSFWCSGQFRAGTYYVTKNGRVVDLERDPSLGKFIDSRCDNTFQSVSIPQNDQNLVMFSSDNSRVVIFDSEDRKPLLSMKSTQRWGVPHGRISKDGRLCVPLEGGGVGLYQLTGQPIQKKFIGEFWRLQGGEWLARDAKGNYAASPGGARGVRFNFKGKPYKFNQFDLFLNRPDLVAKSFGADEETVQAYRDVYRKRLQQLGRNISPSTISEAPEIQLTSPRKLISDTLSYKVSYTARSRGDDLSEIIILNNGVQVNGDGKLSDDEKSRASGNYDVPLSPGTNRIEVIARSRQGYESLPAALTVHRSQRDVKPDLYILSVGVADYKESDYNLQYAAKDARDIVAEFQANRQLFGQVHERVLVNDQVSKESLMASREFLSRARPGDQVVIFMAGHGLIAQKGKHAGMYYYCPHDMIYERPSERGFSYDELTRLIDSTPAQKRLVLLDTCHAGELGPDESREMLASADLPAGVRAVTSADKIAKRSYAGTAAKGSGRKIKELFADLRRGTGATVLTASGGMEFAYESDDWKNGVFTYSILRAMRGADADRNGDGLVQTSEFVDHVAASVVKLTEGHQQPGARATNMAVDFPVLPKVTGGVNPEMTVVNYLKRSSGHTSPNTSYASVIKMFANHVDYFGKRMTPGQISSDITQYRRNYDHVGYQLEKISSKVMSNDRTRCVVKYWMKYDATLKKQDGRGYRPQKNGKMLCQMELKWDGMDWKITGIKVLSTKK